VCASPLAPDFSHLLTSDEWRLTCSLGWRYLRGRPRGPQRQFVTCHSSLLRSCEIIDFAFFRSRLFNYLQTEKVKIFNNFTASHSSLVLWDADCAQHQRRCRTRAGKRAFLWQNGVMTDLNILIPADSLLYLLFAHGINSRRERRFWRRKGPDMGGKASRLRLEQDSCVSAARPLRPATLGSKKYDGQAGLFQISDHRGLEV
jgi:hypothetical protein